MRKFAPTATTGRVSLLSTMVKAFGTAGIIALLTAPLPAIAAPITVYFKLDNVTQYNWVTESYLPGYLSLPTPVGSFTFDPAIGVLGDLHGFGTTWSSPITSLIPQDPYSGAFGPFYNSYVYAGTVDYPTIFYEQVGATANTYTQDNTGGYAYYGINLAFNIYTPARNGDGSSAYAFTSQLLLDALRGFVADGTHAVFEESYGRYTLVNGAPVYSEGMVWDTQSATLIGVSDASAPVPEPATLALFGAGLAGAAAIRRRRVTTSAA